MKVAFVTDYLNQYGGSERVLDVFLGIFNEAPVYTLLYSRKRTRFRYTGRKVITCCLDVLPFGKKRHRILFPLMPSAVEVWDFSNYDMVISLSASFAKGIRTRPPTKHISYLFTPTRFLWGEAERRIQEEAPRILRPLARFVVSRLRVWDYKAVQRPDVIITLSQHIKKQIEEVYRRKVEAVIYPPVDFDGLKKIADIPIPQESYFVIVSRLIPYKRIDIVIEACEQLWVKLKVIGVGRDLERLQKLAGPNTEFLLELSDEERNAYLQNARAFFMPQIEDFGIAATEAQYLGVPVIAYGAGGALEIVKDGETGLFFKEQSSRAIIDAVRRFNTMRFDKEKIKANAMRFSKERFIKEFTEVVHKVFHGPKYIQ